MKNSVTPFSVNIPPIRGGASSSLMGENYDHDYYHDQPPWGHDQYNQQPSWGHDQYNQHSHGSPSPYDSLNTGRSNEESNLCYLLDSLGLSHLHEENSIQPPPNWNPSHNPSIMNERGSSSSYHPDELHSHHIRPQHDYHSPNNLPYPGHFYDARWPRLPPYVDRYIKARFDQGAIMREYNLNTIGICLGLSFNWLQNISSEGDLPTEHNAIDRMLKLSSPHSVNMTYDLQNKGEEFHIKLAKIYLEKASNNEETNKAIHFSGTDSVKYFAKARLNMKLKPQFGKDKIKGNSLSEVETPFLLLPSGETRSEEKQKKNLIRQVVEKMKESEKGILTYIIGNKMGHAVAFSKDRDERGMIIFNPNFGEIKVPNSDLDPVIKEIFLARGFKNITGFQVFAKK